MKSFTRIGLPVLLVVGLVFGITFLQMYSTDEATTDEGNQMGVVPNYSTSEPPLKFAMLSAIAVNIPASGDVADVPSNLRHHYYWDADLEAGAPGHFEFWCQNVHSQPVSVRVPTTNCQCAGVDLAVIPHAEYRKYVVGSVLANGPLCSASGPVSAMVHAALERSLDWKLLNRSEEKVEQTIPAADPSLGPQIALIRVGWQGKGEPGQKQIGAQVYANLPNGLPAHTQLEARTLVVPAFDMLVRTGGESWKPSHEVDFGELRENEVVKQDIFLGSSTRQQLLFQVKDRDENPCITWSDFVQASQADIESFERFARASGATSSRLKAMYKSTITVRERAETIVNGKKTLRQLDLGVIEERAKVTAVDAGSLTVSLKGRVLGDISIISGSESGRIELGNSIPANQDKTRIVILAAEQAGLDLTLLEKEITPHYLKVKLEPLDPVDGRKHWRLRVTIPKGSLFGSLPHNSSIILQTNSPTPRRLSIPVRGMTFDGGGPRL